MGCDIFQRTKNRNEESTQLEESRIFTKENSCLWKIGLPSTREKIKLVKAEKLEAVK